MMDNLTDTRSNMTDSEFLRHVAHAAEIGDPIDTSDIARLRVVADNIDATVAAAEGNFG